MQNSGSPPSGAKAWGCGVDSEGQPLFGGLGGYFSGLALAEQHPAAILRWIDAHAARPAAQEAGRAELQRQVVRKMSAGPRDERLVQWGISQLAWLANRQSSLDVIRSSTLLPMCRVAADAACEHPHSKPIASSAIRLLHQVWPLAAIELGSGRSVPGTASDSREPEPVTRLAAQVQRAALQVMRSATAGPEMAESCLQLSQLVRPHLHFSPSGDDVHLIIAAMQALCANDRLTPLAEAVCSRIMQRHGVAPELPHTLEVVELVVRVMLAAPEHRALQELGCLTIEAATRLASTQNQPCEGGVERKQSAVKRGRSGRGGPRGAARSSRVAGSTNELSGMLLDAAAREGALSAVNAAETMHSDAVGVQDAAAIIRRRLIGRHRFRSFESTYRGVDPLHDATIAAMRYTGSLLGPFPR